MYLSFKEVNKTILQILEKEIEVENTGVFWTYLYPFFKSILNSNHTETFYRYISVSYFPESLEWWEENETEAENFIHWFEKGDDKEKS